MSTNIQEAFFLNRLAEDLASLVQDQPMLETEDKAFGPWSLMLLTGVPVEEAIESFVEGGGDKGLDAIYVPSTPGALSVLQAKRVRDPSRNLGRNDIVLALNGVRWLLNGGLNDPTVGPAFRARAEEFRDAYTTYFPNVDIYLVSTCQGPAPDGQSEIELFLQEANSPSDTVFSVQVIDIHELVARHRRALQETTSNDIVLEFSKPDPYEHNAGEIRALVGSVSGRTLAELFDRYGNGILEANVRNYLGNVTINRDIVRTAVHEDDASKFWFYNNGVTLVCSQYSFRSQREATRVRLINAQIVNGCQTVHSLWHAMKSKQGLRDDVEVLVRIVEHSDPDFVPLVTRYNNSQNAVRPADLVGRETVQLRLKQEMEAEGYYYETRRGDWKQYFASREERIRAFGADYTSRVIRLKEAAQACAAFYLRQPIAAKNKTSVLTTHLADGGLYEEVFDAEITARKVICAVELMRRITRTRKGILRTDDSEFAGHRDWLPHADFFVLALFARQYHDPDLSATQENLEAFFTLLNQKFDDLYRDVVQRMGTFILQRNKEPGYSHPKFFKSEASWQAIQTAMGEPSPLSP